MLKPEIDVAFRPPQPAPARVLKRAFALAALACRSQLEPHAGDSQARGIHEAALAWLAAAAVYPEFEADERSVVDTPLGQLSREAAAAAGWRGEGLAVLAWGLGRWELPDVTTPGEAADVAQALGWLGDEPAALYDEVRLRARTDVVQLAEMLETAQWRLDRHFAGEPPVSLRNFDAAGFAWPRQCAPLDVSANGDLRLAGQPLAQAPEHLPRLARRIVLERRIAVNWLAGQQASYAAVTTET
ncbi:MAG: DUF4272 domain-containing protein [Pseudomonadota bacterium]